MYAAGVQTDATFYCTVRHSLSSSSNLSLHRLQGKIKRTKPFYIDEFVSLKAAVSPEVFTSQSLHDGYPIFYLGSQTT